MKIAVVGTGAMGAIYAALMADAGHEVWAVDTWQAHVKAMAAGGLRVSGASGDRTVAVQAVSDLANAPPCDLYIIATKASGVGPAARGIADHMTNDSLVLTIQNGLGASERIAEHMPVENVLLGVAEGFGAALKGPAHAHHTAMKLIRIGELQGGMSRRLQRTVEIWQNAGFQAEAFADIEQLIWEKFICNVTLSAPCTVFEANVAQLRANPEAWEIALGAMQEAFAVGTAIGVRFSFDDPVAYVTAFAERVGDAKPSLYQDILAGRRSEIDAINGQVPVLGRKHGVATPINDTLTAVIRSKEMKFS